MHFAYPLSGSEQQQNLIDLQNKTKKGQEMSEKSSYKLIFPSLRKHRRKISCGVIYYYLINRESSSKLISLKMTNTKSKHNYRSSKKYYVKVNRWILEYEESNKSYQMDSDCHSSSHLCVHHCHCALVLLEMLTLMAYLQPEIYVSIS